MNKYNISDIDVANAICSVNEDKQAIDALKFTSESELMELLEKNKNNNRKQIRLIIYSVSSIAAIFILFFVLDIFKDNPRQDGIVNDPRRHENVNYSKRAPINQYFKAHYKVPTNQYFELSARGESETAHLSDEAKKSIIVFFDLYDKKQYRIALKSLKINDLKSYPELLFYVSICRMETGKISEAKKELEYLSFELDDSYPYWQDANWYLALTYLRRNQIDDAKNLLEKIKNDGGLYAKRAVKILGELLK